MRSTLIHASFISIVSVCLCSLIDDGKELQKRLDNGLGQKPALGWNSWNVGGCKYADAATALKTAKLFISLGLKDVGYQYVNIDDCWSTMARNSSGYLVPDPAKWPNGIQGVTAEIHDMGLKFGLYGCAGTKTCAGYPGSQGYEVIDAKTLASWGVDYWKYDNCNTPSTGNSQTWYVTMRDALLASGRPILYSLCNWGNDNVWTWGGKVGNSWRMSSDIRDTWSSMSRIAAMAPDLAQYAGPGGFNDLDMMASLGDIGTSFIIKHED
jgi:alpha-galactosidase